MMHHPEMAQQLATARQRDLIGYASRQRQAHTARGARAARAAGSGRLSMARTRPLLRRVQAVLGSH